MKYIDRKGKRTEKDTGQDRFLYWLYSHMIGRVFLRPLVQPAVSKAGGWLLNTRLSSLFAARFVKKNGIDLSRCEKQRFDSYNDFFIRKYKKEPPQASDAHTFISPCDGKLSVFAVEEHTHFKIKHTDYTLEELLRSRKLALRFKDAYVCVFRLTVHDYHRYCYIDDGIKSENHRIPGIYHTVNPAANDVYPIYKENTREFCLLKSRNFGTMLIMEVGALLVGKIVNYDGAGAVIKGGEKGRFEFGGSTIVVLINRRNVIIDKDILENTREGYETIVKQGEGIGRARLQC